ncbi:MAG TPA: hypothetical protein PK867_19315, partial [Pirellulales bacterium]|nr:hypothetical protein [Pirellulales bacterium]
MIDRRSMLLGSCAVGIAGPRRLFGPRAAAPLGAAGADGDRCLIDNIEGWPVRVEPSFRDREAELCRETLEMLRCQLCQIKWNVPGGAANALRQTVVYVSGAAGRCRGVADRPGCPRTIARGAGAATVTALEIGDARAFLDAARDRPWAVLHALTLGYYHARLAGGAQAEELVAAHAAAVRSGKYDRVLCADGGRRRHHALTGAGEYF